VFYKAAPSLSDVNSGSTTTSPSVTHRPPPPLDMTGQPATSSKPVARQLFSPRDGAISDSIGSPRRPAADDGHTTSAAAASAPLTNHPTMALTMDRGTGGGPDGGSGSGGGGGATRAGQGGAPGTTTTTSAMDIVARRRVSVSGDGAVLGRSPVQDEGAGLDGATDVPVTTYHADYSLRQTMG